MHIYFHQEDATANKSPRLSRLAITIPTRYVHGST